MALVQLQKTIYQLESGVRSGIEQKYLLVVGCIVYLPQSSQVFVESLLLYQLGEGRRLQEEQCDVHSDITLFSPARGVLLCDVEIVSGAVEIDGVFEAASQLQTAVLDSLSIRSTLGEINKKEGGEKRCIRRIRKLNKAVLIK